MPGEIINKQQAYKTLELSESASDTEIRTAYKRLALKYHPDKNSAHEATAKFQEIGKAYALLSEKDEGKSSNPEEKSELAFTSESHKNTNRSLEEIQELARKFCFESYSNPRIPLEILVDDTLREEFDRIMPLLILSQQTRYQRTAQETIASIETILKYFNHRTPEELMTILNHFELASNSLSPINHLLSIQDALEKIHYLAPPDLAPQGIHKRYPSQALQNHYIQQLDLNLMNGVDLLILPPNITVEKFLQDKDNDFKNFLSGLIIQKTSDSKQFEFYLYKDSVAEKKERSNDNPNSNETDDTVNKLCNFYYQQCKQNRGKIRLSQKMFQALTTSIPSLIVPQYSDEDIIKKTHNITNTLYHLEYELRSTQKPLNAKYVYLACENYDYPEFNHLTDYASVPGVRGGQGLAGFSTPPASTKPITEQLSKFSRNLTPTPLPEDLKKKIDKLCAKYQKKADKKASSKQQFTGRLKQKHDFWLALKTELESQGQTSQKERKAVLDQLLNNYDAKSVTKGFFSKSKKLIKKLSKENNAADAHNPR